MRLVDWRTLDAATVEPLVDGEAVVYRSRLGWDVARAWSVIEPARRKGRLPGLIALDDRNNVTGWTCFVTHRATLQVAMLVASDAAVTDALVTGILESETARGAADAALCLRDAAPGLAQALGRQGFEVGAYRYLSAPASEGKASAAVRSWRAEDRAAAIELIARAYHGSPDVRPFALHDTAHEWDEYVSTLIAGPACGRFLPEASFAAEHRGLLAGVVLSTDLGPSTAHIAQLAVDPSARKRGLGRSLILAALAAAAGRGATDVTLLVSGTNAQALALYAEVGFTERASFVAGVRRQPCLSTSEALATAGASTRL